MLRKSQERIVMAQDDAAGNLVKWMSDASVPMTERRKCAEALLNRGGNAPGQRLEVSLDPAPWVQLIEGIVSEVPDDGVRTLGSLERGGVVDGQVVDDPQPLDDPDDVPTLGPPACALPTPQRIPSRRVRGSRLAGH